MSLAKGEVLWTEEMPVSNGNVSMETLPSKSAKVSLTVPDPEPSQATKHHLPPSDPTRPPPTRHLMRDAKRASTTNVTKAEKEDPKLPTVQKEKPPRAVGFMGVQTVKKEDADDISDDIPKDVVVDERMTSSTAALDQSTSSYLTPLGPRYNIIDLDTMKDQVWFIYPDWKRRLSGFFLLIILASVIATCGILTDSAATVIGAMIVVSMGVVPQRMWIVRNSHKFGLIALLSVSQAPLMTPIMGMMLGVVLTDFANTFVSANFVFLGVLCAVGTGFAFSTFVDKDTIIPENNSQVAARIAPRMLDLIAAIATGAVASVALIRSDIAGSLPGVSIAISLVPPLNVVGVCLRLKDWEAAAGAGLLFVTNFICILVVGVCTMFLYRIHRMARVRKYSVIKCFTWVYQKGAILAFLVMLLLIGAVLSLSSMRYNKGLDISRCLRQASWPIIGWQTSDASEIVGSWEVYQASASTYSLLSGEWKASVIFAGEPPFPRFGDMSKIGEECEVDDLSLVFVPTYRFDNLRAEESEASEPADVGPVPFGG